MVTRNHKSEVSLVLTTSTVCILLVVMSLSSVTRAAPSALPPRPTPQPTPALPPRPTPQSEIVCRKTGGFIVLRFRTTQERVWGLIHWQELWSVVQWQDGQGNWHNVEGWQGGFDVFYHNIDEEICEGRKTWWVDGDDFIKGPFRWVIYQRRKGKLLAQSELFYLPLFAGQTVRTDISLVP